MMTYAIEPERFTVGLSLTAHDRARRCRDRHANPEKGKQVYLNTLAVYAVRFYLQCQGYEIEESLDDSRNLAMQVLMDTADVEVKNYGKIECRPVLPEASTCEIPAEVWGDRIAYVAVYLDPSLREATLLGFARQVSTPALPLDALDALENLPLYLQECEQQACQIENEQEKQKENSPTSEIDPTVALGQWFDKIWDAGWQTLDSLLPSDSRHLALGLRSGRDRDESLTVAKVLELGQTDREVMLLLAVQPVENDRLGIRVQLHPASGQTYLPHDAVLALLSKTGETLREVPSRALDNFIQLPRFKCCWGERFSLSVTLGDAIVREEFQLRSNLS